MDLCNESPVVVKKMNATTKNKKSKKRPVNRNENLHLYDTDLAEVLFGGDGGIRPAPFVFGIKGDDPAEDTEKQRYSTLRILKLCSWSKGKIPKRFYMIDIGRYISIYAGHQRRRRGIS